MTDRQILNRNLAQMLKGGVIMDVTNAQEAEIAEAAGAVAVMALERVPSDIRRDGGVARMSDPKLIKEIKSAVSIPVMAKVRIGHIVEAEILEALGIDYIDESEVLTPADDLYHLDKHAFKIPFVCGARNLGEALRRIGEGAAMIRTKGEAGTGKQRMAHGIHQASARAAGPLITLRCGDTTPELLEQELFGVMLDPEVSHQGRLELASGGTLFLDEIEKMPKNIAAKLADALTTGRTTRIGEDVERTIDVRIIAACDSDLKRLTERGLFARELYECVSKSVVRVPALRSRREDIPKLAEHIVSELAEQHQMDPKRILPETDKVLRDYDWPGNIKQLQSVLEYAFFNTAGSEIGPDAISLMGDVKPDNKWKEDKDVFVKAWKAAGGNVSRLANLLNVSRVTLYRYLKKYGLEKK